MDGREFRKATATLKDINALVGGAWEIAEVSGLADEYVGRFGLPPSRIRGLFESPTIKRARNADPGLTRELWSAAARDSPEIRDIRRRILEHRDEVNATARRMLETNDSLFRGTHADELDSILEHGAVGVGTPSARGGNKTGKEFGFLSFSVLERSALRFGDVLLEFDAGALRRAGAAPVEYDMFATKQGDAHEAAGKPMSLAYISDLEVRIPRGEPLPISSILKILILDAKPGAAGALVGAYGAIAACAAASSNELKAQFV